MSHLRHTLAEAAQCIKNGGVLIFPTETYYALGCLATDAVAVEAVYRIKNRGAALPLPLLAADMEQIAAITRPETAPRRLFDEFWPGPLTVLLPALPKLPRILVNASGRAAVRVSSHRQAAELARLAGGPLTASSANVHGRRPASQFAELDQELVHALVEHSPEPGLFAGDISPAGGLPSTLVEPLPGTERGKARLRLVRAGAVSAQRLEAAGFYLCQGDV